MSRLFNLSYRPRCAFIPLIGRQADWLGGKAAHFEKGIRGTVFSLRKTKTAMITAIDVRTHAVIRSYLRSDPPSRPLLRRAL